MKKPSDHPTEGQIRSFIDHNLPAGDLAGLERHLEACQKCRLTAETLRQGCRESKLIFPSWKAIHEAGEQHPHRRYVRGW